MPILNTSQLLAFLIALLFAFYHETASALPKGTVVVDPSNITAEDTSQGIIICAPINGISVPGRTINGDDSLFLSVTDEIKQTKLKVKKAPSNKVAKLKKKLKTLKGKKKVGLVACAFGTGGTPTPTPDSSQSNFDIFGNVTAKGKVQFGIPTSLSANIDQGHIVYNSMCVGCHSAYLGRNFNEYREKTKESPMLYNENSLPEDLLANLTAYLNRFNLP